MLALALEAELNGVTELQPLDTQDEPYYYTFRVQCTSCREVHSNWVSLSRFETNEMSGSRGEANFVWRCKACKRESSASIVGEPRAYTHETAPNASNIIEMDCRGLEFIDFKSEGEWKARGLESVTKFAGIDLQEGEWYDYDEKTSEEVSVKEIKWVLKRA